MISSCSREKKTEEADVLMRYGDKSISLEEVVSKIPAGLLPADSLALFNSILDSWITDEVLAEFAETHLIDVAAIDRRVKDYRNSLIVQEYLTRMRESRVPKIDEKEVKDYYEQFKDELKLEVPLVKGIFMKINSDSRGKDGIKYLMSSKNPEMIDKLEQEWLDRALEYNYFRDKWIDWETLISMIPYRFGDPDLFLSENKYFETEYGDCSYYLQISDYLPSGEQQPFEFAYSWIAEFLTQGDLSTYQKKLVESIVSKSIKDKKLELIGYDPLKHEMIENNVRKDNEKR